MSDKTPVESGETYQPYVKASASPKEITIRAIVLGTIISVLFGMANAYIGLMYGMTVSASIPAAVISMAVLRGILKRGTVLENNMVQTIGSAGESLVAGVIFTFPAFLIWQATNTQGINDFFQLSATQVVVFSLLGGSLGILLMIPLRRYLVQKEHNRLRFPEGTACAEIIIAGDQGGSKAQTIFSGIGIGALYKTLMVGIRGWNEEPTRYLRFKPVDGGVLGIEATPILLGIGFIIGPRISALMLAGAVLGYLGIGPLIKFVGLQHLLDMAGPGMTAADIDADFIRGHVIKYLGVGAVTVGGFVSLLKSFPTIISSFSTGFKQILKRGRKDGGEAEKRTDQELPMWVVLVGAILIILVIWAYPNTGLNPLAIAMVVIFGFLFVVVAARIVGLVGSSSSPVSGMTIATLLVTCLMLTAFGISGAEGMVAAMSVGAVVCIAVCLSGDIAQDLKTGFLLGATPKKMQIMEFVGLFFPALTMGFILFLLGDTYGFVESPEHPNPLLAPQANIMAAVVNGILGGVLPWEYIIAGGMIALAVEFLGIGSLPFAIGLYLPLSLSTPIMAGGLLSLLVKRTSMDVVHHKSREQKGILFASGLVAGDALVGVAIALMFAGASSLAFLDKYRIFSNQYDTISIFGAPWNDILSLMFFGILMLVFWRFTFVKKR